MTDAAEGEATPSSNPFLEASLHAPLIPKLSHDPEAWGDGLHTIDEAQATTKAAQAGSKPAQPPAWAVVFKVAWTWDLLAISIGACAGAAACMHGVARCMHAPCMQDVPHGPQGALCFVAWRGQAKPPASRDGPPAAAAASSAQRE